MKTTNFTKSKQFKILLGFAIVFGIIVIAKTVYTFGQWLHQLVN